MLLLEEEPPVGKSRRSPAWVGPTTVRFTATAFTPVGIPHRLINVKTRGVPPLARAGPPMGTPAVPRVSTMRHGVTV